MLILDLDDTIYETRSIDPAIFDPVIGIVRKYYKEKSDLATAGLMIPQLWTNPVDVVFERFGIPESIAQSFQDKLNTLDYHLEINTFDDYAIIKEMTCEKILVTTGFSKLQEAKIDALEIRDDFKAIYIDDPQDLQRKHKLGIFKAILKSSSKSADQFWVIGDNPSSELKAAKALEMKTIQRKTIGRERSELADHYIESFVELEQIFS